MGSYIDPSFRESLLKKTQDRTAQDLTLINANLKSLEALSSLRDTTIRSLCKTVHYTKHEANDVLYRSGDVITCWYILLSGSVFIDGSMFLPRSGFGRRSTGQIYRIHDCLILETSEMLVIDYPSPKQHHHHQQITSHELALSSIQPCKVQITCPKQQLQPQPQPPHQIKIKNHYTNTTHNHHNSHLHPSNQQFKQQNKHRHHHELHTSHLSSVGSIDGITNDDEELLNNILNNEIIDNKIDLDDEEEDDDDPDPDPDQDQEPNYSFLNNGMHSNNENDFADLNLDSTDNHGGQNNDNKSICIITGTSPCFKPKSSSSSKVNNAYDLNTSQQTISSNTDPDSSSLIISNAPSIYHQATHATAISTSGSNVNVIKNGNQTTFNDDGCSAMSEQSIQMTTKDIVREVLEKDPKERTEEDIDILFEFMQSFPVIFATFLV
jgi:hypothetical protein